MSAEISSADASLIFRITRGQTKYPERPIQGERFLIGAGSNCQLQLGGQTPLLHSIVTPHSEGLWIEAVVSQPALVVNGTPCRESVLRAGDEILLGDFEFMVAFRQPQIAQVSEEDGELANVNADTSDAPGKELSVEELVAKIEAEVEEITRVEQGRQLGAAALLEAARRLSETPVDPPTENVDQPAATQEIVGSDLRRTA